ncbi:PREDICTED: transcriptional repressor p66-alpha isoform X1 [Pseudopodoces humilis]|uniref:transcriptional repressor p66-alpha isoform X1 n=1 Tax=Pseudopodoces humilis TaxID=181119 RepID=UPI0006B83693|nr:PREDICTED: transcriptional repressor p66-alpha isoform X1 [Pseudopodoces humilis]
MSEDSCRTRSQKRALERESEPENKKLRMDKGIPGSELGSEGEMKIKSDPGAGKIPGMLKSSEVKATIKVELPAGDEPVDMSTSKGDSRRDRRAVSPDVIVLSDTEAGSPRLNGLDPAGPPQPGPGLLRSPEQRERLIRQLQEELRLEEAKLVLLKKLRQSQSQKEAPAPKLSSAPSGSAAAAPPPLLRGPQAAPAGKTSLQPSSSRIPGSGIPPPLLRGGQAATAKLGSQQNPQIVMPPLVRGAQQIHTIRQHSSSGPPPLLLAPRASVPSVQLQGQRIIQQGLIRVANVPSASLLVNIPQASPTSLKGSGVPSGPSGPSPAGGTALAGTGEAPGSRQAAAKLALRKQLEKTLLEIPPPKPPAPEMNFLPSAANNEFIYLVGLEEVVQNLLETQGKVAVAVSCREPYLCAQCHTDFTCRWREEKNGTIMCETCMASNQKKALKAEHTNRLKAAFVKALQQEQEIEQRILQQTAPPGQPKAEPVGQHHALKQSSSQMSRGAGASRGVLHAFSSSPKLQSSSATLGSRPGKHSERSGKGGAASWKKNPIGTGGALPFVSPALAVHKSASAVERQREYLLDMIPPRSIPQSATWK